MKGEFDDPRKKVPLVLRVAPGPRTLVEYRRAWLRQDAVAGLSVAAVALPTGDRVCGTDGLRAGGGLVCVDPPVAGICHFWHLAPPDRESGRGHLRDGGHDFDAADGSPLEFTDLLEPGHRSPL